MYANERENSATGENILRQQALNCRYVFEVQRTMRRR